MVLIWTVGGVGLDEDDLDDYQLLLQRSFLESPPATGEECSDAYAAAAVAYESTFAVEQWSTSVAFTYMGLHRAVSYHTDLHAGSPHKEM